MAQDPAEAVTETEAKPPKSASSAAAQPVGRDDAAFISPPSGPGSFAAEDATASHPHQPDAGAPVTGSDGAPFGAGLEPVLREACEGRLSEVRWFRTDWQRGGALTGYATWRDQAGGGDDQPVVVKFPIPPRERYWLTRLQGPWDVVPTVHAHGEHLNGYDLAWVVMEALPHGPLGPAWAGAEFDLLTDAAGRFYAASETPSASSQTAATAEASAQAGASATARSPAGSATPAPPPAGRVDRDWPRLLELARRQVRHASVPDPARWKAALKKAGGKLDRWLEYWHARPIAQWCHGDLHLANAMTREGPPEGPALLLDLAQVRPGHWVEDAVYLEHLYWAMPHRLGGRKLVRQIAHQRKDRGLALDPDWAHYAQIKRALLAMATPARLSQDGSPKQLAAALEVLERHVR